jgi:hypothetical protein
MSAIDADEQIVRINKMQAEITKMQMDTVKVQAEIGWLPWQVVFAGMLATAGLLGAGAALAKLFFG